MRRSGTGLSQRAPELAASLRPRHVSMIAFGGAIGAGIFVGSGSTIAQVGPAVVLSYLVVGVVAATAMRLLSVQAQHHPDSGAFATYVGEAFGHIGRFSVGWMYWWLLVCTVSVECLAAADIAHSWLPDMPVWGWSLLFFGIVTAINFARVRVFSEFQYWLVLIKITLLIAIPLLGVLALLGLLPGIASPGFRNIETHGGLVPHGPGSIFPGVMLAAFSFVGIEMTAIASAEAARPALAMRQSTRIVTYTTAVGYVSALFATVVLVPWDSTPVATSPFGAMMSAMDIPAAEIIVDVVVLTAVLSVATSSVYAASRMGFSLAGRHDAPKSWQRLSSGRVPVTAVLWTSAAAFALTLFGFVAPTVLFNALIDSSGVVLIMVWIAIALSYLKLRPAPGPSRRLSGGAAGPRRRLGAAALFVSLAMATMLIGMLFLPATRLQLVETILPVLVIFVVVLWRETSESADPDW